MTELKDASLKEFIDLATESSSELGWLDQNSIIDYESGKTVDFGDQETAKFIASARSIVLELARRLQAIENPYGHLSQLQWGILTDAQSDYGTSIGTWEETKLRQACDLEEDGLLKKQFDHITGRNYYFFISIKGRRALATHQNESK